MLTARRSARRFSYDVVPLRLGDGVLDARNHQGKFGQDYVRALASAAGLIVCNFDLVL